MTSTTEAATHLPLSAPAKRGQWSALWWLSILIVFVIAVLLRQVVPLNTDVSWLLTVGERVLNGEHLYSDIVEINPPMAMLAYLPGIALARALALDPKIVIDCQLLLLTVVSLVATWRILACSPTTAHVRWAPLAVWSAAVLTILPMQVYGQREHMATLTFLPALAVYMLRADGQRPPLWAIVTAGVGAGITLAFKPFFVAPVALCIVLTSMRARSWQTLFAPENWIAGVLVGAFSCYTYLAYPEYFSITYPLVRDTYLSWSMPVAVFVLNSASLISVIAAMAICYAYRNRKPDSAVLVILLASLGFAISFFLQRRGWSYHSYPMVAVSLLGLGYLMLDENRPRIGAVGLSAMAATFALGIQWFDAAVYIGPIEAAVAPLKPNPRILVLSGEAAIGHPLVRTLHGTWVSREENLWIREFVRLTREHNVIDPPTDVKLNGYLALERSWLIEDFKKLPPDIVLVDNLRDGWGDWAHADSELTRLLRPYVLVRTVQGIDILRRVE